MSKPAVAPNKALGQHFLHDQRVLAAIALAAAPEPGSGAIEIGPGTGNLTEHLLQHLPDRAAGKAALVLIELDRRTPAVLHERFGPVFDLVMADAAHVDWPTLLWSGRLGPAPVVVGNLPYYAALPILFALLDLERPPPRIVIMVQKEVADRLIAPPSHPSRGQISPKVQLRAEVKVAMQVGRGAFQPPPNVQSSVVVLRPYATPQFDLPAWPQVSTLITQGFAVRRKTLHNALVLAGRPSALIKQALDSVGLAPMIRAEALNNGQWAALARALAT